MYFFLKSATIISLLTFFSGSAVKADECVEGLHYRKINTSAKQIVHILDIDPTYLNITVAHANGQALGRETVASIAKRHKAIAAVNGGFFKIGDQTDGLPAGILKIHGNWYGIAYRPRGAIGWSNQLQMVLMDRIQTKTRVYLNHHKFPVHAVNQPAIVNRSFLYTDVYGKKAGSLPQGYDVVIQNNQITKLQPSGKTAIPKGGYVYSIGAQALFPHHPIEVGNTATIHVEVIPQFSKQEQYLAWQMVDNIIGGTPLLIHRGKIIKDHAEERVRSSFIFDRYARTAVGILKNGHWVFVVVEQSALSGSAGMTIPDLAAFMKALSAEYALNLDGGGSSTLYINNMVVNHPEGEEEEDHGWTALRPVSDAILILPGSV